MRIGFCTVPGLRGHHARDEREEHVLLLEHVRQHVVPQREEHTGHGPQLGTPCTVDRLHLLHHRLDAEQLLSQVGVIAGLDVPRQGVQRSLVQDRRVPRRSGDRRAQLRQQDVGVQSARATDFAQRSLPTAAEIDRVLLEHLDRARIPRGDVRDLRRFADSHRLHGFPHFHPQG
jgi:hypothetical protein